MPKKMAKKLKIRVENKKIVASKALRLNCSALDATAVAEKKKLVLLKTGVAGFMVIFFAAWIFSLKYQFKTNANNNDKQDSFNWVETKAELDKTMSQVKEGLKEIKQIQAARGANTLPRQPELTAEQIDLLKGRLLNEAASSTKN